MNTNTNTPAWKLVPTTPTEEMHAAAVRTIQHCNGNADFPPRVYRAMLDAAPAEPQAVAEADAEWFEPLRWIAGLVQARFKESDTVTIDEQTRTICDLLDDTDAALVAAAAYPIVQAQAAAQPADPDTKGMLRAACADLGRIAERLGIDPGDAGADPILAAIDELTAAQPADAPTWEDIAALARVSDHFEGSCSTEESYRTLMRLASLGRLECDDFQITLAGRAAIQTRTHEGATS